MLGLRWQEKVLLGRNRKEESWQSQAALWEMGVNLALLKVLHPLVRVTLRMGSIPCE